MISFIILAFTVIETAISFLSYGSTYLSYPSGIMGDTSPTTLEEVIVSRNVFIGFLFVLLFSYFLLKYKKYISELVHGFKVILYFYIIYLVINPVQTYWIVSRVIYFFYCIFGIVLIIKNYQSLILKHKFLKPK